MIRNKKQPAYHGKESKPSSAAVPGSRQSPGRRTLYVISTVLVAIMVIAVAIVLRNVSDSKTYNNYMTQAQQCSEAGDFDGALSALRKAAAVDRTEECLMMMVDCYELQGNYTRAMEILRSMDIHDLTVEARISSIEKQRQQEQDSAQVSIAGKQFDSATTSLVLENMGLGDSVLDEIKQLHSLESLSLSSNNIEDITALGELGGLVTLNLSGNQISELQPLASLVGLRTLYLDNNPIKDLAALCCLPNLTSLSIKGVEISRAQLDVLASTLPNCAIHSEAVEEDDRDISFGGATFSSDVTELNLSGMGLRDISVIANCTELIKLDISGNEISDLSPLMNIPNLQWLDVSGNNLTDLKALMGMEKLTFINASGNDISDTSALSMMNGVTELYLDDNPIRDFAGLRKVKSLNVLGLSNTGLNDEGMLYLSNLTLLTNLYIENNPEITGETCDALQSSLATCNIHHSELVYTIDVEGYQVRSDTTELDLSGTGISDLYGLSKLHKLEKVNLSRNNISNIYVLEYTESRFSIKEMDLSGNKLEDITAISLLQNVEVLDLSNNMISSELPLLNLKTLKKLYLGGNLLSELQIDTIQNSLLDCEIILD